MPSQLYRGTPREISSLTAFCRDVLRDTFWPVEEFLLSLKIPQTFLLYREGSEGEDWHGFALGRVMGGVAELFFIFVRPALRGQGLAVSLLEDFESYAGERYCAESVMLEVRVSNNAAIRLYEKLGYARIHTRKRYYQDGEDAYVYEKPLASKEGPPA